MISDQFTAWIRTVVPVAVGALCTWAAKRLGLSLDSAGLTAAGVTVATGVYYLIASTLERKWPVFGILLGSTKGLPTYTKPLMMTQELVSEGLSLAHLFPPGTKIEVPPAPAQQSFVVTVGPDGTQVTPSTSSSAPSTSASPEPAA